MEIVEFNALMDCMTGIGRTEDSVKEISETVRTLQTQIQAEHMAILIGIGALMIVGIAILINQIKLKKMLRKLLEKEIKP